MEKIKSAAAAVGKAAACEALPQVQSGSWRYKLSIF